MSNWVTRQRDRLKAALTERQFFVLMWGLRAAAASLFFAFISNLATLAYAVRYGARPPVEGVPYLSLTVGFFGFLLVILTVTLIYLLPFIVRRLRMASEGFLRGLATLNPWRNRRSHKNDAEDSDAPGGKDASAAPKISSNRTSRPWGIYVASNLVSAMGVMLAVLGLASAIGDLTVATDALRAIYQPVLSYVGVNVSFGDTLTIVVSIVVATFTFQILSIASDKILSAVANALYLACIAVMVALCIWSPLPSISFENLLRFSRFGGGLPVDVTMSGGENLKQVYLFLTSQNAITIYDQRGQVFRELNRDHIIEMKYRSDSGWLLPEARDWTTSLSAGQRPN